MRDPDDRAAAGEAPRTLCVSVGSEPNRLLRTSARDRLAEREAHGRLTTDSFLSVLLRALATWHV